MTTALPLAKHTIAISPRRLPTGQIAPPHTTTLWDRVRELRPDQVIDADGLVFQACTARIQMADLAAAGGSDVQSRN